jgi:hypothetical protein
MKGVSHLTRINDISRSIKTTIPRKIIEELKLDFDDVIEWKVDVEKGHKFARVRKLE